MPSFPSHASPITEFQNGRHERRVALLGDDHSWAASGCIPGVRRALGLDGGDAFMNTDQKERSKVRGLKSSECAEFIRLYRVGIAGLCGCWGKGHTCGCFKEVCELGACEPGSFRAGGETHPLDRWMMR